MGEPLFRLRGAGPLEQNAEVRLPSCASCQRSPGLCGIGAMERLLDRQGLAIADSASSDRPASASRRPRLLSMRPSFRRARRGCGLAAHQIALDLHGLAVRILILVTAVGQAREQGAQVIPAVGKALPGRRVVGLLRDQPQAELEGGLEGGLRLLEAVRLLQEPAQAVVGPRQVGPRGRAVLQLRDRPTMRTASEANGSPSRSWIGPEPVARPSLPGGWPESWAFRSGS